MIRLSRTFCKDNRQRLAATMVVAAGFLTGGCQSVRPRAPDDVTLPERAVATPMAAALAALPIDAEVVAIVRRPDRLLRVMDVDQWRRDFPAELGKVSWDLFREFGVDPLAPGVMARMGIDARRPIGLAVATAGREHALVTFELEEPETFRALVWELAVKSGRRPKIDGRRGGTMITIRGLTVVIRDSRAWVVIGNDSARWAANRVLLPPELSQLADVSPQAGSGDAFLILRGAVPFWYLGISRETSRWLNNDGTRSAAAVELEPSAALKRGERTAKYARESMAERGATADEMLAVDAWAKDFKTRPAGLESPSIVATVRVRPRTMTLVGTWQTPPGKMAFWAPLTFAATGGPSFVHGAVRDVFGTGDTDELMVELMRSPDGKRTGPRFRVRGPNATRVAGVAGVFNDYRGRVRRANGGDHGPSDDPLAFAQKGGVDGPKGETLAGPKWTLDLPAPKASRTAPSQRVFELQADLAEVMGFYALDKIGISHDDPSFAEALKGRLDRKLIEHAEAEYRRDFAKLREERDVYQRVRRAALAQAIGRARVSLVGRKLSTTTVEFRGAVRSVSHPLAGILATVFNMTRARNSFDARSAELHERLEKARRAAVIKPKQLPLIIDVPSPPPPPTGVPFKDPQ